MSCQCGDAERGEPHRNQHAEDKQTKDNEDLRRDRRMKKGFNKQSNKVSASTPVNSYRVTVACPATHRNTRVLSRIQVSYSIGSSAGFVHDATAPRQACASALCRTFFTPRLLVKAVSDSCTSAKAKPRWRRFIASARNTPGEGRGSVNTCYTAQCRATS